MNREDIVSEVAKVWDRRAMEDELTHASIKIMAQHVEIEQLREANEMMLTDIRRTDVDMLAFKAEIERLRAALKPLACTCPAKHQEECSRSEVDCPFWNARAALEGK